MNKLSRRKLLAGSVSGLVAFFTATRGLSECAGQWGIDCQSHRHCGTSSSSGAGSTYSVTYDHQGRVSTVAYADGRLVSYEHVPAAAKRLC
jgi:YD repeat-containing protein